MSRTNTKYWFANLAKYANRSKNADIDKATAIGGWGLLSKASLWYDHATNKAKAGVEKVLRLLTDESLFSEAKHQAWVRDSNSVANSTISRTLTSYPKTFWYNINTKAAGGSDADLGEENNPIYPNIQHPFQLSGAWDVYITRIIVKTNTPSAAAGTYKAVLATNAAPTSTEKDISGANGVVAANSTAGTVNVITPLMGGTNQANNIAPITGVWTADESFGIKPSAEADCENWQGEIFIECFCPELYTYGLGEEFGDSGGKFMKNFI